MELVILVMFWGICGIVAAMIAESRGGEQGIWLLVGFLLGPIGILAALFAGSEEGRARRSVARGESKRCPMCAEAVLAEAIICKHCGHDFYAAFKDDAIDEDELMRKVRDFELQRTVKL